ncbi:MAG: hypothetical protein CL763_05935 [Chloroflexi bacterium]|nr:hypothetical protein [Chloroflexota bacterium]
MANDGGKSQKRTRRKRRRAQSKWRNVTTLTKSQIKKEIQSAPPKRKAVLQRELTHRISGIRKVRVISVPMGGKVK